MSGSLPTRWIVGVKPQMVRYATDCIAVSASWAGCPGDGSRPQRCRTAIPQCRAGLACDFLPRHSRGYRYCAGLAWPHERRTPFALSRERTMSRRLKVSSAQLGPINLADSRASVVEADGRDAEGGRFARLEVRGVPGARAHHLLPALLDGRPERGREVLREPDAEPGDGCRCSSWRAPRASASTWAMPSAPKRAASRTTSTPRSWSDRTAG